MKNVAKTAIFPELCAKMRKGFRKICSHFEIGAVQRIAKLVMPKNAYLGVRIGFDAEENEPSKVWSFG